MPKQVILLHCSASIYSKTHTQVVLEVDGKQVLGDSEGNTLEEAATGAVNNALGIDMRPQYIDSTRRRTNNNVSYHIVVTPLEGGENARGCAEGMMSELELYILAYLGALSQLNYITRKKNITTKARPLWEDD